MLPLIRTRLALALISLITIALELTFMRGLALRFWSHFACMVISVGLLGFGAAGTFLTLFRTTILRHHRAWLCLLGLLTAAATPIAWWGSQVIPLDVGFLAWSLSQAKYVLAIELLMFLPFLLAGSFVGIALLDSPQRINGHYAANLLGSGAGAILAILAMYILTTLQLLIALTAISYLAALLLIPWRHRALLITAAALLAVGILTATLMPWDPAISPYKRLAQARNSEGTQFIYHTEDPLGQIDVLSGPFFQGVPGLSLQYMDNLPSQAAIITDGDSVSPVYDCHTPDDYAFLDWRTAAAAFQLRKDPRVCIVGSGGGGEIGLALFHRSPSITALEMDPQIIAIMSGPLATRGGAVYNAPAVHTLIEEARGFFAPPPTSAQDTFDIIQLPPLDAFGASGSGLYATQESYLYTVESLRSMLHHLSSTGILSLNRWVQTPPREELRAFDMAVQALRQENLDPSTHIAMLRSMFTTTILLFKEPLQLADITALRAFSRRCGFDFCYLPGLAENESNLYHKVNHPYYFQGTQALLGPPNQRNTFLTNYPFDITAPTDDQPYFFHSFRWSTFASLKQQFGASSNAFLEMGYFMLLVGLIQTIILGLLLILLPLTPGLSTLRKTPGKAACVGYFLMLGLGFMLLEMGFVGKLILYLAHPIFSASIVIASFLTFAGLGSQLSAAWRTTPTRIITAAITAIILIALTFLLALDAWLSLTQSWPIPARCLIAALTIAPLAFAMGHLFPLGLQRIAHAPLVPWSWAINGFASVTATAAAPLLAMRFGFSHLVLVAITCYLLAALTFRRIPHAKSPQPAATPLTHSAGT